MDRFCPDAGLAKLSIKFKNKQKKNPKEGYKDVLCVLFNKTIYTNFKP